MGGVIAKGYSAVDESILTGESLLGEIKAVGMIWVGLLSLIVCMPIVTSRVKHQNRGLTE